MRFVRARRRALVLLASVTVLVVGGGTAAFADGHGHDWHHDHHGAVLFVSPGGSASGAGTSCATAKFATIQSAVDAALPGQTVSVCPGTYNEQVTISTSHLTITGAGATTIIDPSGITPATVTDLDSTEPIVPIVDVTPGTTDVALEQLVVDGSGLTPSFTGCSPNFAGILFQAASGSVSGVTVQNLVLPIALGGCQSGQGIWVESGTSGTAWVTVQGSTVNGYDKGGITCDDAGTFCEISGNTVTGTGPNGAGAENGVQIGFGARGQVEGNQISANDWSGATNPTEPQADFAAGVLLYGAAGRTDVSGNTLTDNQIGVEVVHSDAGVHHNTITETSPGITGSVGVFAAPCDFYCSFFSLSGGNQRVEITGNTVSFPGSPVSGTDGIWVGDGAASASGSVHVEIGDDSITGAENNLVLGPTATGSVQIGDS